MNAYAEPDFEAFWPHYVRLHTRRETHVLHAIATLSCLGLLAAAVVARQPALIVLAPLADFAIAQASHRLYEHNVTTPWKNQLWHTRAELRMLRLVLTGRMGEEVSRLNAQAGRTAHASRRPAESSSRRGAPRSRPAAARGTSSP